MLGRATIPDSLLGYSTVDSVWAVEDSGLSVILDLKTFSQSDSVRSDSVWTVEDSGLSVILDFKEI